MTDRIISLDAAIEAVRNFPPGEKLRGQEVVEALSALPAVDGWLPKPGDRVCHNQNGWIGVVEGHRSDQGIIWCRFDLVGLYGAVLSELTPLPAPPEIE